MAVVIMTGELSSLKVVRDACLLARGGPAQSRVESHRGIVQELETRVALTRCAPRVDVARQLNLHQVVPSGEGQARLIGSLPFAAIRPGVIDPQGAGFELRATQRDSPDTIFPLERQPLR